MGGWKSQKDHLSSLISVRKLNQRATADSKRKGIANSVCACV